MDLHISESENLKHNTKKIFVDNKEFRLDGHDHDGGFFTLIWPTDYNFKDAAESTSKFLENVYDGELSQEDFVDESGGFVYQDSVGNLEITGEQAYSIVSDILEGENPRESFNSNIELTDEEIGFFRLNTEKVEAAWTQYEDENGLGVIGYYTAGEELANYALKTGNVKNDEQTVQELVEVLEDYTTDI